MDKTDRISFSKSFDLAGQNKLLKEVYKAKTINIGGFVRSNFSIFGGFVVVFWSSLGYSGEHLGMIMACSGWVLGIF